MRTKHLLRTALTLFAAAALWGCPDDSEIDASTASDTGPRQDAAPQPDAAPQADAGPQPDAATQDATVGSTAYVATLSGAEENPPVASTASGTVQFMLETDGTLRYTITHNVPNATMGHIHRGQGGVNGPVVTPIMLDGTNATVMLVAADVADLEAGRLYINVHSMVNAGGEIRGQILLPNETLFSGQLQGAQEVPPVATTQSGAAAVILNAAGTRAHIEVTTTANPTMAHIHRAHAGASGPVVYPLAPAAMSIRVDQDLTAGDVTDLQNGIFYVNVHTAANAGGEVRAQLLPPGSTLFSARLTGAQETPPVITNETGSGMMILDYRESNVRFYVSTTAMPSMAHVHNAAGGVAGPVVFSLGTAGMTMLGTNAVDAAQATALKRGVWYFNVHTVANAGGEVRGQILAAGETLYTATLSGLNEVPPVVTTASGGFGAVLNAAGDSIRYNGALSMITPTNQHIHNAAVGMSGPVVYPLTLVGGQPVGEQAINAADLANLNLGSWYVNIHTAANGGGEIRGQLERK